MRRVLNSFFIAFSTYSKIPMPQADWTDENRRFVMCFFPLVGAAEGLVLWGWLWLSETLALGAFVKGAVAAAVPLLVTGGIHMDGFMDTMDALGSWRTPEKRLEIMKDSHTGAFAVMGCAVYLMLSAAFLSEAELKSAPCFIGAFMLSRALSAFLMTVLKSARPGGMLDGFKRTAAVRKVTVSGIIYLLLSLALFCLGNGPRGLLCLPAAAVTALCYRRMALKQFGGVTGDLAGWFLEVSELVSAAVIVLGGRL